MEDDSSVHFELGSLVIDIKKEVCGVIAFIFSFLTNYDKRKAHNMLCLMLDPKYKSLKLRSSFIGHEQGVAIVEEYDGSLFILLKFEHYLHLLSKVESSFLNFC